MQEMKVATLVGAEIALLTRVSAALLLCSSSLGAPTTTACSSPSTSGPTNQTKPIPHAFVHTLDFADGVWCLDIDPNLDLTNVAGSLAVGGNRLYVASANGWVGSFLIPSITNPTQSPTMGWTAQIAPRGPAAPVITANDDGVVRCSATRRLVV